MNAVNGIADFSGKGLNIDLVGTNKVLTAASLGLTSATTSPAFSITAGPASRLALTTQPSASAANGAVFAQQPVIQLRDAAGNAVSQAGVVVTAAIASGGGTLGGTLTATTDAFGVATFTNLAITGIVGERTLTFTAPNLTSVTSNSINITAGAATQIAVNAGDNQAAWMGTVVPIAPSVIVRDASNNPVSGVSVTFAVGSGGGSLAASGTVTTNGEGIATSPAWTLGTTAGTGANTLTATSTGLAGSPVTFIATAVVGASTQVWTSRTSAADNQWFNVAYGNGLWVAVAITGIGSARVMTSPDGINWTIRNGAGTNQWLDVVYANNLWVAVGNTFSRAMSSPDGINWTIGSGAADNDWRSVAYGNGLWVAVARSGTGNRVMTSPDGINWTSRSSAADNEWFSVAYGNGLFVAVSSTGTGNRVMTSPDGINWTSQTSAADNAWRSVAYGNGLWVAVAGDGTGDRVMTSPDGITWTSRTSAADNFWNSVAYGNGLWVAVAGSGTGDRVMTSPDGITWTSRTSAADNAWRGVAYGNDLFVAVANTGTGNLVMTMDWRPTQMAVNAGNSQSATVGSSVATAPSVIVRDANGNPVEGVGVSFAVASGGGSITGANATTNDSGIATVGSWTLGTTAGANSLTASVEGLTDSPVTFTATAVAGAATQLALTTPAAGASCGAAFTTQPAIQLRDVSGNAVSQSGVEVTMSASSGATVVGTATATTNASGVATFLNVGIDGPSGSAYTLTFAANGLTSATQIIPIDACIYLGGSGKGDDTDATGLVDLLGTPYYQWLGGTTDNQTDWFTTTNWNPDIVPGSDIGVYIGPSANQPRISGTSPGADVLREKPTLIQDNATLTLEAGPLLTLGESSTTTTSGTGRIVLEPGARYLNLSSSEPLLRVQQRLAGGTEPGTGIKGWRMVGAPVATSFHSMFDGLVLQGFAGSDFPDLQANLLWWDETDRGTTLQHWRQPGNRNEMIPPGRGHFHYVFNGAGRLNPDGSPSGQNYTDILPKSIAVDGVDSLFARATEFSFPVTFSARDSISSSGGGVSSPDTLYLEINQANAGWNLMANPTPSFLDWGASSGWTRTGIGPTIYVWDPAANSGNGDYLIWNQDSNTGTLHGGGGGGSGILAPYQAFWVQATCEGESCPNPVLRMSRQALTSSSAPFLRKSDALEKTQANGTNYSTGGTSAGRSTGNTGTAAGSGRDSRGTIDASDRVMQRVASASDNASAMSTESHATPEKAVLTLRVQQQELSTSALMVFTPEGSIGYDPSDAPRLMPMNDTWIAVYTRHPIANAAPLHLNHLPYYPDESQWSVDLEVAAYRQGMPVDDEFELSWELSEGWPDHLRVYLVDQRMRTLVPLSRTETYSFTHQTTLGVLARGLITNSVDRGGDNGRAGHSATKLPPVDATHGAHSPGGASQDGRSELRNGFQDDITQHNWLSAWSIHPRYPTTVSGGPGAVLPPGPVLGTVPGALNHGAMGRTLPGVNSKDTASRFQILIRDTETDVYLPEEPFLSQNFPNPFNPVTTIAFGLPTDQHVRIDIYDITGRLLTSLANGSYPAGTHQVRWNAANYASGVYLVRMQAEGRIQTRKMTLIK
jgi:hypothetical protein